MAEVKGVMSPIVINTKNVYEDLEAIAYKTNVDINSIDFNILAIYTKYKTDADSEFKDVDEESLNIFNDDEFISNKSLVISQSYNVEYFDKSTRSASLMPKISLGANKSMTKIVATIKESLDVKYTPTFESELINTIYKKLIKVGVLIGIRNSVMLREIKRLTSVLRIKGIIDKSVTFVVTSGLDALPSVDDAIIYYYINKTKEGGKKDKVDYANRGFIQSVSPGELIIEYIKPKFGSPGRNVKGELIPVNDPKVTNQVQINYTDNIEMREDENSIKYFAKKNGYVSKDKDTYDIADELDVNEVSFKTTGSIDAGLNTDVKINIKESDVLKDAVGTGMSIETAKINVEGNVAKNARIVAKEVNIGGQTHAKSTIEADSAFISVHLGKLTCDEATIDRLEGGYVKAKKVTINSAIGGEIIASEVYIGKLFSNVNITASVIVQVDELKGSNNKFIIDAAKILDYEDKFNEYMQKISNLQSEIAAMPRELKKKRSVIESNKESVNLIKQRIEELRNDSKTPPISFINKLKDFQALVQEYNTELKEFQGKKAALDDLHDELRQMQSMVFNAKIINKDRWKELNEIKFKLIEPKKEIIYSTKENELAKLIMLKHLVVADEDVYEIKKSNEIDL